MESKTLYIERLIKNSWKSFMLSFFLIFVIHILQVVNFHPFAQFLSPVKEGFVETTDVMRDIITPQLQRIKNSYSLNYNPGFIPQAQAEGGSFEDASAYVLVDFDSGDVLIEKNLDKSLSIASLTKIMTAVVALDLADKSEEFRVTENAAEQIPTKIGIVERQKLTVDELLHALLMTSANDAAELIKDGVDEKYGEEVFIKAMNEKAKIIGLKNTSFTNPQGFDNRNHYSTVEDLAVLSHYALTNYPKIAEIVKKDYVYLPEDNNHKQFDLYNWNGLIGVYPETSGIKIGNTGRAGKTTVVTSERNGKKLLAVVLGAPGLYERDIWAADLLDDGYQMTEGLEPIGVTREQLQRKYDSWSTPR